MPASTPLIAYIALGANLGDRAANIGRAIAGLRATPGVRVLRTSALIENPAVGGPPDSPPFLNGVVEIETMLDPHALLQRLLEIESQLGRIRRQKWEPRAIDLDILLFGSRTLDADHLTIPHPLMHQRPFVLKPLVELAPDLKHPILNKTVAQLLAEMSG